MLDTLNPTLGPTTALEREVLLAFRESDGRTTCVPPEAHAIPFTSTKSTVGGMLS